MTDRTDLNIPAIKARLEKERDELLHYDETDKDVRGTQELDQTRVGRLSRMDALQMQEMAKAGERRRKQQLVRIEQALERIEQDDYGYCAKCDAEIPAKRLEWDPAIPCCVHCA